MSLIVAQSDPSPKERKILGMSLGVLGGVVALLVWLRPGGLAAIGWVSGLAWCASMLFNREEPLGRQWKGVIVPLAAGLLYFAARSAAAPATLAVAAAAALVALGSLVWLNSKFGNWFYQTWSLLFLPLAWSVSALLLALVYYAVFTPIGLVMRMAGRDPMQRTFDRQATSYWVERDEDVDSERYFRQF